MWREIIYKSLLNHKLIFSLKIYILAGMKQKLFAYCYFYHSRNLYTKAFTFYFVTVFNILLFYNFYSGKAC